MEKENLYIKTLVDIGLPENEAKVYLAILSLGETTALQIARVADIKRTTVYHIIEALKQKGFISIEMKGLKSVFIAEDPERLSRILESKTKVFAGILPDLSAKFISKNNKSSIREYQGLKAVKMLYEGLLKEMHPHDYYLVVSNQEEWHALDPEFFQKFIERRAKMNLDIRLLLTDTLHAQTFKKIERNYNEKIKILSPKTKLSTNLIITPNKVIIHRLINPISAIILTDPTIINMHKESFEIMWEGLAE